MPIEVARPSVASLYLVLQRSGTQIGTATGFVVERDNNSYLVTNRHVVLGKGEFPDVLVVVHNRAGALGQYDPKVELLYDKNGEPLWFEHPTHPTQIDVAALPLTRLDGIEIYSHDPWDPGPGLKRGISDALHIIGFPFGITGGAALGIWVRGFIASEPDIDWQDLPCFLIDSRTRQGQSGSPVIGYETGTYSTTQGSLIVGAGAAEQFFGVYSGRIAEESDLGVVWKSSAVREIIDAKQRAKREATP